MPQAHTWVEGFVPNLAAARQITVHALRSLENRIKYDIAQDQFQAFQVGGHHRHGGTPWAPLSPSTIAIKAKEGAPRPAAPLVRSSAMSASTRVNIRLTALPTGVKFSIFVKNTTPYSGYHMKPTFNHWSGTFNPTRMPVQLTQQDLNQVRAIIEGYMGSVVALPAAAKVSRMEKVKRSVGRFFRRLLGR